MTGLEKIIEHIRQDSIDESDKIIAEAKAEVAAIMAESKEECDKLAMSLNEASTSEINLTRHRGESAAALAKRKLLLQAKQQLINDVLEDAKAHLLKLSDKEYFDIILKMIKKYSLNSKGEIILSAADLKRLPTGFNDSLEGTNLTLSNETRDIDGGFVLLYGDIEENCSFDAIISAEKEVLQDKIGSLLFDKAD